MKLNRRLLLKIYYFKVSKSLNLEKDEKKKIVKKLKGDIDEYFNINPCADMKEIHKYFGNPEQLGEKHNKIIAPENTYKTIRGFRQLLPIILTGIATLVSILLIALLIMFYDGSIRQRTRVEYVRGNTASEHQPQNTTNPKTEEN